MAAPLAPAVSALTAVLEEAINNSKIAATLDKEISKALGLLVDLVLLPFLPLLIGGIIALYEAIIVFGKWWDENAPKEVMDAIAKAFSTGDPLAILDALAKMGKYLFNDLPLAVLTGIGSIAVGIVKWLFDFGWKIGTALADGLRGVIDVFVEWVKGLLIFESVQAGIDIILGLWNDLTNSVKSGISGAVTWILDQLRKIPGVDLILPKESPSQPSNSNYTPQQRTGGADYGPSRTSTTAPQTVNFNIQGDLYPNEKLALKTLDNARRMAAMFGVSL